MKKQPEALRLADLLVEISTEVGLTTKQLRIDSSRELRRLHELEVDALRYRAIRGGLEVDPDNSGIVVSLIDDFGGETLQNEKADEAIDAAIALREALEQTEQPEQEPTPQQQLKQAKAEGEKA